MTSRKPAPDELQPKDFQFSPKRPFTSQYTYESLGHIFCLKKKLRNK